tara:strand:+ start:443 stop:619 length:177 start_codon:yes stop_codon:yes gene_type:complete
MSRDNTTSEEQKMIDEWLKTNKPTICPPGTRTEEISYVHGWGKKKKKKEPKEVDSNKE